jgi:hypothetical protein
MNEARDEARRKAERIDKEKAEARRAMAPVRFSGAPGGPSGFGTSFHIITRRNVICRECSPHEWVDMINRLRFHAIRFGTR